MGGGGLHSNTVISVYSPDAADDKLLQMWM